MSLGFDIYESEQTYEKEGITGEVTKYSTTALEYPCFIVDATNLTVIKLEALKNMLATPEIFDEYEAKRLLNIYIDADNVRASFGKIAPMIVEHFVQLIGEENIRGYLSADKEIKGMYLYALGE